MSILGFDKINYHKASPYFNTEVKNGLYLSYLTIRPVPARSNDILYTIESQYTHRPDLLAFDLYQTPDLWWVFAQRNLDTIRDPIYDFEAGVEIFLPQSELLRETLGVN
jgi:hypothetical protein